MKRQVEIATIKAVSAPLEGKEIFWVLSRNQLEILLKEVETGSEAANGPTARYQEGMLPLINLEQYYGLKPVEPEGAPSYLVVRSVNANKELVRFIIETPYKFTVRKLEMDCEPQDHPQLPQNGEKVLGIYSLAAGQLGIVPDLSQMAETYTAAVQRG